MELFLQKTIMKTKYLIMLVNSSSDVWDHFLDGWKKSETYWFEYHNDGEYEVRSDNNLGQKFEMTTHQLLGNFYPVECETDICAAMDYAYWLGELGFHHGYIEEILRFLQFLTK